MFIPTHLPSLTHPFSTPRFRGCVGCQLRSSLDLFSLLGLYPSILSPCSARAQPILYQLSRALPPTVRALHPSTERCRCRGSPNHYSLREVCLRGRIFVTSEMGDGYPGDSYPREGERATRKGSATRISTRMAEHCRDQRETLKSIHGEMSISREPEPLLLERSVSARRLRSTLFRERAMVARHCYPQR